jgi:clan AA aspartic protease (TIGR02281 family)
MKVKAAVLLMLCSGVAFAGHNDYYECTAADGTLSYSVAPCARGDSQRRIGDDAPAHSVSLGAGGAGTVQVAGDGRGHFQVDGAIDATPVHMLVDTGAPLVSVSPSAARRIGLDTRNARLVRLSTASGATAGYAVTLPSVAAFGTAVNDVPGVVMVKDMPGVDVLLGMSFLRRFELNVSGNVLSARPR